MFVVTDRRTKKKKYTTKIVTFRIYHCEGNYLPWYFVVIVVLCKNIYAYMVMEAGIELHVSIQLQLGYSSDGGDEAAGCYRLFVLFLSILCIG